MACVALLALLSQEISDGVFAQAEHGIRLGIPDKKKFFLRIKDFEFGWPKTACELGRDESELGGVLVLAPTDRAAKEQAEWRMTSWSKQEGIADFRTLKSEKPAGRIGDWWLAEYRLKFGDRGLRYLSLFCTVRDRKSAELALWSPEEHWALNEPALRKIAEGFQAGDGSGSRAPAPIRVRQHRWKEWAPGTTVVYRVISEEGGTKKESSTTLELLKKSDAGYTLLSRVAVQNGRETETVVEVAVDPNTEEYPSGETPDIKKETDNVKVGAGEFECEKTTAKTPRSTSIAWTSPKVPAGLVKSTVETAGGKTSTELVRFVEKK